MYRKTTRRSSCSTTTSQQQSGSGAGNYSNSNSQLVTTLISCFAIIQHLSMQGNEEAFPSLLYYGTLLHDIFFVPHLRTPVQRHQQNTSPQDSKYFFASSSHAPCMIIFWGFHTYQHPYSTTIIMAKAKHHFLRLLHTFYLFWFLPVAFFIMHCINENDHCFKRNATLHFPYHILLL